LGGGSLPHTNSHLVKSLIFRPAAAADVEEAYHWYESKQLGIGAEFLEEVQATVSAVQANPEQFPVIHRSNSARTRPTLSLRTLLSRVRGSHRCHRVHARTSQPQAMAIATMIGVHRTAANTLPVGRFYFCAACFIENSRPVGDRFRHYPPGRREPSARLETLRRECWGCKSWFPWLAWRLQLTGVCQSGKTL
jgi:hypothetical protein